MPRTTVSRDQFEWEGDRLVHQPTGAWFAWAYPNSESASITTNWGTAGDVLDNGDDFYLASYIVPCVAE